jgi:hypothetical protein
MPTALTANLRLTRLGARKLMPVIGNEPRSAGLRPGADCRAGSETGAPKLVGRIHTFDGRVLAPQAPVRPSLAWGSTASLEPNQRPSIPAIYRRVPGVSPMGVDPHGRHTGVSPHSYRYLTYPCPNANPVAGKVLPTRKFAVCSMWHGYAPTARQFDCTATNQDRILRRPFKPVVRNERASVLASPNFTEIHGRIQRSRGRSSFHLLGRVYSGPTQNRCFSPRIRTRLDTGTGEAMIRSSILFSASTLNSPSTWATNITPSSRAA